MKNKLFDDWTYLLGLTVHSTKELHGTRCFFFGQDLQNFKADEIPHYNLWLH